MATRTRSKPKPKQKGRQKEQQSTSRLAGVQRLARDTVAEVKKVTWPDREQTRNLTLVVIAISTVLGLLLGGIDAVFVKLWQAISAL